MVESQYACPICSQILHDLDQLKEFEESDKDYRIWDSTVNMCIMSDSENGKDSYKEHSSIGQSKPENDNDLECESGTIRVDSVGPQEDVHLGIVRSILLVLCVTQSRRQDDSSSLETVMRKHAGTGEKQKKR
ncbi:hypothetical protein HOY80DRAFT_996844 [Tuber brumale]|nr:hypothetical protein HOY80DRAFT_996844 [Tuber brumale]